MQRLNCIELGKEIMSYVTSHKIQFEEWRKNEIRNGSNGNREIEIANRQEITRRNDSGSSEMVL